jgi:hypothetical protein
MYDLNAAETEVWREFRFSTKAVIAELLRLREQVRAQSPTVEEPN